MGKLLGKRKRFDTVSSVMVMGLLVCCGLDVFLFTSLFDGSVKYDVVAKKLTIAGNSGYVFWCAINSVLQALGTQENRLVF